MFLAYPYTDLYNLNLDWMIKAIKEVQEVIENLGSVVNTFNEREGDVVLTSEDVNSLEIDSVVTLPEGSFDTITEAQKTAYYTAGKRILVALDSLGEYSKLGFLYKAGATVGMAEYVPNQEESAVLSFNGRTGRVTLNDSDVNNLQIRPVLQLNGSDVSSLTTDQKLQYFDAGIRFIHCVPVQGDTITTQKLYTLNVNESGGTRIPYVTAYDPLQGQGLVKAVNSESPNTSGQLYLYADDIEMANDDDDTVYSRITNLESAAVESVNGVTPTQGAVVITGGDIQVAADDDTTIDEFAVDVYSELEDRVKSVNGVTPTQGAVVITGGDIQVAADDDTTIDEFAVDVYSELEDRVKSVNGVTPSATGAVTLTGADIAVSASDATKVNVKFNDYQLIVKDSIRYITGALQVDIQATGNVDYEAVLNAVYTQLVAETTENFAIVDVTLFVTGQAYRWYLKGFISKPNTSAYFELSVPLIRNTPIIAAVRAGSVFLLDGMPSMKDLAYFEQYATATKAYTAGDYVFTRDGLRRVKANLAVGVSLQNATYTDKMDTTGVLNTMQYEELVLSASDFISGTITDANFQMSLFRFGPLKLIKGRITFVGFNSSLTYVDVLNIPSRFMPENSTVVIATTGVNTPINIAVSLTPSVLRIYKNPDVQEMTNFPMRFMCVYF